MPESDSYGDENSDGYKSPKKAKLAKDKLSHGSKASASSSARMNASMSFVGESARIHHMDKMKKLEMESEAHF